MKPGRVFYRIRDFYRNIKLRERLLVSYTLLIVFAVCLLGYYAYNENVTIAQEQIMDSISGSLDQSSSNLNNIFNNVEKETNLFSSNLIVQNILTKPQHRELVDKYDDYINLDRVINTFERTYNSSIKLLLNEEYRFLNDGVRYVIDKDGSISKKIFSEHDSESSIVWRRLNLENTNKDQMNIMVCAKKIRNMSNINEVIATVIFIIDENAIRAAYGNLAGSYNGTTFIMDREGYIISSSDNTMVGKQYHDKDSKKKILAHNSGSIDINSEKRLVVYKSISNQRFYIVVDISTDKIALRSLNILRKFLAITALILLISFAMALVISGSITRRIKRLIGTMSTIEQKDFEVSISDNYNDEISTLIANFSLMSERIKKLIEDVYKANVEKKKAEINLLQAQINPHFLYNTLDSINWLAVRMNASEISFVVKNLSDFLRLGLAVEGGGTTVEKEIKHVVSYFNIQKFRFEDKIHLVTSISEDIYHYRVLPLILQPLIENCIIHGILKEEGRRGTIKLSAQVIENMLIFEVSDDGIGISKPLLKAIIENLQKPFSEDKSYGLRNVHQRIKYTYGEEYGLDIISEDEKGTSFVIIIPALRF
jgi:two-component system, sensor histidine kinase YesM